MKYAKCTKEIVDKAVELITEKGYTQKEAAKELNVYYRTLLNNINLYHGKIGGYKGKKNVDSNYFEIIDTEHKAYWLGFLTADGYLSNRGTLELTLAEKDAEHVALFKKCLQSEHTLIERDSHINGNVFKQYRIAFTDQKIASDLRKYGVNNNKTFNSYIPFEHIPKHLIRHYIRGLFDGDGSVFSNGKDRINAMVVCTASITMGNDLISCLFENDISSTYSIDRRGNTEVYSIYVNKTREIQRLYKWMYNNATIYLERKHNRFAVSGQIAWRPEMIRVELSGEVVKP
jgi:intein/homing endonuclease